MNYTFRQLTSRPDSRGRCRVLLDVTWDNQRAKLPTGVSCQPAHFRPAAPAGKPLILKPEPGHDHLNARLLGLVADLTDLFTKAQALRQPVARAQVLALGAQPVASPAPGPAAAPDPLLTELLVQWEAEHPTSSPDARRRPRQVAGHLEAFHPGLRASQLTKPVYLQYLAYLHAQQLSDSTIGKHGSFLRSCLRLAERHIPTWLTVKVRHGRAVALRREELLALAAYCPAYPYLRREQERLLFQTLLLLRDSDLRQLRAHHVTEQELPGVGRVPVLEFYQKKTGDEVRLPLPPLAAAIWERWGGQPPLISQQNRNLYLKELAEAAGLARIFVRVRFRGGQPVEQPLPLCQAITTHTPRHTGADLVLWGSQGDQNLKEAALGHLAGASVYGYDTLERYGPLFLRAWEQVGAPAVLHPENTSN